jgi:hypothetical protein
MAHFSEIDENNVVLRTIIVDDKYEEYGSEWCHNLLGGTWIQTSYNTHGNQHKLGGTPLRGNFAGIGYTYDSENDVFYTAKPFDSWTLNETTWLWECPVAYPTDGKRYTWNESTTSWDEVAAQ